MTISKGPKRLPTHRRAGDYAYQPLHMHTGRSEGLEFRSIKHFCGDFELLSGLKTLQILQAAEETVCELPFT